MVHYIFDKPFKLLQWKFFDYLPKFNISGVIYKKLKVHLQLLHHAYTALKSIFYSG